jgi:uncharacterized protein (UPF0332 family)
MSCFLSQELSNFVRKFWWGIMHHLVWVDKSVENLAVAEWCYEHGHFYACANRLYYAMFHAALAALLKYGIKPRGENIRHDWVQAGFSGQLIHRRKVFPREFRQYLLDSFRARVAADYQIIPVSKNLVTNELKKAKEFIATIIEEVSV